MKSQRFLLISLVVILTIVGGIAWWIQNFEQQFSFGGAKTIFFYSVNCFDCQATEKWFEEHKVTEKMQFERKEISSPVVQAELQQAVTYCKLEANQGIGVPFLFAEGKCYLGAPQIEGYFQQKLNLEQ